MIALYNAGASIFRAMGNSTIAMKTSLLMNAINLGGNALLIYGFHRGVEGVAIPTLVSRGVACVVMLCLLNNQSRILHIHHPFSFKTDWMLLKKILYIGIPNGLENSMFQLGAQYCYGIRNRVHCGKCCVQQCGYICSPAGNVHRICAAHSGSTVCGSQ